MFQLRRRNREAVVGSGALVPIVGFETDRDLNAAYNILSRGFDQVGVVHSDLMPAETTLPTNTDPVSAKRVWDQEAPSLAGPQGRGGWGSSLPWGDV